MIMLHRLGRPKTLQEQLLLHQAMPQEFAKLLDSERII